MKALYLTLILAFSTSATAGLNQKLYDMALEDVFEPQEGRIYFRGNTVEGDIFSPPCQIEIFKNDMKNHIYGGVFNSDFANSFVHAGSLKNILVNYFEDSIVFEKIDRVSKVNKMDVILKAKRPGFRREFYGIKLYKDSILGEKAVSCFVNNVQS